MAAIVAMVHGLARGEEGHRWIWIAGGVIGLSFGLKLTELLYIVAIGATVAVFSRNWRVIARFAAGTALGAAVGGGAWFAYLLGKYRNPFFPFFNSIFHSSAWKPVDFADERWLRRNLRPLRLGPARRRCRCWR